MDAIEMLTAQHRQVDELFEEIESAKGEEKRMLFIQLADMLAAHSVIEERHFYPMVRAKQTEELLDESLEEHLSVKRLLSDLLRMDLDDERYDAKISVLKEQVQHHVEEEEGELFPQVKKLFDADVLEGIGQEMTATMVELVDQEPRNDVYASSEEGRPLH